MKLSDIAAFLFPMRAHLLSEIDYLKSQLAQERRRVDVLQEGLLTSKKPSVLAPPARVSPTIKPKPVGWEATRAEIRNESREAESQRLSEVTDSGGADSSDGDGPAVQ